MFQRLNHFLSYIEWKQVFSEEKQDILYERDIIIVPQS